MIHTPSLSPRLDPAYTIMAGGGRRRGIPVAFTAVRPGSDAEKKGIRPGDQLLSVNGYVAVLEDVWKINYVFRILRPQAGLRIVLRSSDGVERQLDVMAELRQRTKDPWQQMDQYERLVRSHRPAPLNTALRQFSTACLILFSIRIQLTRC
jgi:hypothetical protein